MFKRPHLKVVVSWFVAEVLLICLRFLCIILPLLLFDLYNVIGRGTDTVSMGLWLCDWSRGSAEKCVTLQLCVLVPPLGCHFIHWVIFLDKRDAPSQVGWTRLSEQDQVSSKQFASCVQSPEPFTGQHLDIQRLKDNMRLNITCRVRKRSRGNYRVRHRFCKSTDSTLTSVSSDRRSRESLLPTRVCFSTAASLSGDVRILISVMLWFSLYHYYSWLLLYLYHY